MKRLINLIALLLVLICGSVFGQTERHEFSFVLENTRNLPQCSGDQTEWTNCFGVVEDKGYSIRGEFISGNLNGKGLVILSNGGEAAGDFKDAQLNGRGYVIGPPEQHPGNPKLFSKGKKFIGEFKAGKLHGFGIYEDGWYSTKYQGIWENGEIVHQCKVNIDIKTSDILIASDCKYEEFKQKKKEENEKNFNRKNLTRCNGNNMQSGTDCWGKYQYENGTLVIGEFRNGTLNGEGKIEYGDYSSFKGERFVGNFSNNIPHGYGIYKFSDGSKYFGELQYGRPHGDGVQVYVDGKRKEGAWKNGVLNQRKKIDLPSSILIFAQDLDEAELVRTYIQSSIANKNDESISGQKLSSVGGSSSSQLSESKKDHERINISRVERKSNKFELLVTHTQPGSDGNFTISIRTNTDTASLKINGNEEGGRQDGKYSIKLVARAGQKTDINIVATDIYGNTDTKTIAVSREVIESKAIYAALNPAQVKRQPDRDAVAIIIGIADYKSLPKADYANDDARVFYDYAIRALGVKPENIKLLVDADADEVAILKAFRTWLPSKVRSSTDVYVYYSGHGYPVEDGTGLYLLPLRADREFIARTSIQLNEINADLQAAKPKSVTIFMDACYSGQARNGETLVASARPIVPKVDKKLFPDNFTVITASQADQWSSSSPELKHGIFSYYLMKGMEGEADANRDGRITLGEMQAYLVENVGRQAGMLSRKQEPQIIGDAARVLVGK